ncbi:MAG: aldehyde ferredoxin oxidoreductase, partial [Nitrososphaeria archaeon]|nr:aldehyde ferredoxin oxidoreductase [Nitrososphaeria archaeon]
EGVFDRADEIGGDRMESMKVSQRGCPNCNMTCGNVVKDVEGMASELDYENVAMLGSNIGLGDLEKVAFLNRMADEYGIDTISLGNSIGFAMESSERSLLKDRVDWGDFESAKRLVDDIAHKRELGATLSLGVKRASEILDQESMRWALHVKGLEVSAYDCHFAPGMALAYATSPIGAHHKDAWVIAWEVTTDRSNYGESKVDKVIELQRIRGGMFEFFTTCRLPWVEVGLELDWYPRFFEATTGIKLSLSEMFRIADRIYSLIRAFWIREYGSDWNPALDIPPPRWFEDPPSKGSVKGSTLDRESYANMLSIYYRKRGWNEEGIPKRETLEALGMSYVSSEIHNP